jgi:hypothetical protein
MAVFLLLSVVPLACTGGGSTANPPPLATPTPTPTPTPSPTPGPVVPSSTSLTFLAAGAASAQTFTVSEAGYPGNFTATTTNCGGIASIAPPSGRSFTVTAAASGSCTFTIANPFSQSATVSVGVTTTTVGGN